MSLVSVSDTVDRDLQDGLRVCEVSWLTPYFASVCLVGSDEMRIHDVCKSYLSLSAVFKDLGIL